MREITLETKIHDLLTDYEGMKEILIGINPKFKKLNNPVLRRTLGRVAGVRQAAIVGGMDPIELLNQLREAVGQDSLCEQCMDPSESCLMPSQESTPTWVKAKPKVTIDANEILDREQNPLAIARKTLKAFAVQDLLLIKADFRPEPLIEAFIEDGYAVHVKECDKGQYETYVRKMSRTQ